MKRRGTKFIFIRSLDLISKTTKQFKLYHWQAINPTTQKFITGDKLPTIENSFWEEFKFADDSTEERTSKVMIYLANKNHSRNGQYKVVWNDNDNSYDSYWFSSLEEANEFVEILHSCHSWMDLHSTLRDAREIFDYESF